MTHRRTVLHAGLALALALLPAACGDGFAPTPADVAGTYDATSLSGTIGDQSYDLLAAGSSITLTLTAAGAASGQYVITDSPLGPGSGGAFDGTYTISGTVLRITVPGGDPFVSGLDWEIGFGTLRAITNNPRAIAVLRRR